MLIEVEDYARWEGQWQAPAVIRFMFDRGLVPVARDFEYKGQYNILFLRRSIFQANADVRKNIEYFHSVLVPKFAGETKIEPPRRGRLTVARTRDGAPTRSSRNAPRS